MDYERTIPFEGDFINAANVLKNTLLPLGYQIVNQYDNSIEMEGARSFFNQNQNILTGISWINLQKESDLLILKINCDRIKKNFKFIAISSVFIDMIAIAILTTIMLKGDTPIEKIFLIAGLILFGLVTAIPMMYLISKNTATKAVNIIVNNIASANEY